MEREELEKIIEELMNKAKGNKNSIDMGEVQSAVKDLSFTDEQMESFLREQRLGSNSYSR